MGMEVRVAALALTVAWKAKSTIYNKLQQKYRPSAGVVPLPFWCVFHFA